MWIRRLRSKLLLWFSQIYHPDDTGRYEKLGTLNALDPELFRNYAVSNACIFMMRTHIPDIEQYTKKINYAIIFLVDKAAISNVWCQYSWRDSTLDSFFIDKEGRYLDPVKSVSEFKLASLTFLRLYFLIMNEQVETDGYNARVLTPFQDSILETTRALLRYSHYGRSQ